ncbi:MAG: ABC transporter substrate-binding protein [Rhodospirillales bacterium]|nr:ABC transporter substrate-binding protein [Rhodospirillales bacterium]
MAQISEIVPIKRLFAAAATMVLSVLLLTAGTARAGAATADDPGAFLSGFAQRAVAMLADQSLSEERRREAFRELLTSGFDVELIGRFALGRFWNHANEAERREYRRLFEEFVIATYARRLGGYSGETLKVGASRDLSEKGVIVDSQIIRPKDPPVNVEWRLRRADSGWRIVDIVVEGISMAVAQRSEFASVITNNGGTVEGLLKVLRKKTGG